jgi:3'-phosphoadenosine 5'-phosphosulfate sulfotransferase (PAPS reductase)/FAD synthetase
MNDLLLIKASYGNDSIAMIQHLHETDPRPALVIYSDTGWSSRDWPDRVDQGEAFARRCGYWPVRLASEGFAALAKRKMGFPRQGMQFCTEELKVKPSLHFMDQIDPDHRMTVCVGKRREESANRAATPEHIEASVLDGGRRLWHPIVALLEPQRNDLIRRAGFDVLPHRSMECFPCINSNRADILALANDPDRVAYIADMEKQMGHTRKGKPRTMFRPYRYMGATGINEIIRWGQSKPGQFDLDDGTAEPESGCYSGQCGI